MGIRIYYIHNNDNIMFGIDESFYWEHASLINDKTTWQFYNGVNKELITDMLVHWDTINDFKCF
jgi:hypothetical protein